MKKTQKKFLAIILLIIMFLNTMLPIAQALEYTTEDFQLVTKEAVNRENEFAIFGLQYEAYDNKDNAYINNPSSATPKKSYVAGDIVKVTLTLEETDGWVGMSSFQGFISYDSNLLEPISTILTTEFEKFQHPNFKVPEGYVDAGCSFEEKKVYVNSQTSDTATLTEGTIVEMYFVAKVDSRTKASVIVHSIEAYGYGSQVVYSWEDVPTANTPTLAIPEEGTQTPTTTHGIEITKTNIEGQPITNSDAIYRIVTPNGDKKLVQTNDGTSDGKGLLSDLTMPTGNANNTYNYTIEEVKAPTGYELDEQIKTLTVKFNTDGTIEEAKIGENVQTVSTDNVILLSFSNEVKEPDPIPVPESSITFVVNKKDENGNLITGDSAAFALEVETGDVRYLTTTNGTATKTLIIPEDTTSKIYKLNETDAPSGYILDGQDILINVEFTKNDDNTISVTSANLNSGTNATISNLGNTVTIDVINEKEEVQSNFNIDITKVDEKGNAILNAPATFMVTTPSGTIYKGQTAVDTGKVSIIGSIPTGELNPDGYTYKIQEIKAPTGYKINQEEMEVTLVFIDEAGIRKLSSATVTGGNVTKGNIQNNTLPLSVVNEKEPGEFSITLNKVDEEGNAITSAQTHFQLTKPNGDKVSLPLNALGNVTYTDKMPEVEGEYTYKLLELVAPTGYILNINEQTMKLNFEKNESGDMTLTNATVVDPISKVGNITNNNLTINFKNETEVPVIKVTEFELSVAKIEKESGSPITTATAIFQLLDQDNNNLGLFETETNGVATIKVDLPEAAGTINYKLIEKVAPNGYKLDETTKTVSIEFVEVSGQIQVQSINVTGDNVRNGTTTATTASMSFENELMPPVIQPKTFELVINKKDSKDLTKNIAEADVWFTITGEDGIPHALQTDSTGKISLTETVPEVAKTITYEIQEIKQPTGYSLYSTTQYVDITFEEIDGVIQITGATVRGEKIQKDFAGVTDEKESEVIVSVLNDKDDPEVVENFMVNINKVDESLNNILQSNVFFTVKTAGEQVQLITTDESGVGHFTGTIPNEAKTVTYTLTELKAPENYEKNENDITLNLVFTEDENGKIVLSNIIVNEAQGVRTVGTVTNNTAEIKIINKAKQEQENFTLNINKQDKENQTNIYEAGVGFEIIKPDGTSSYVETDASGVTTFTGAIPETVSNLVYKIKEKTQPSGYIKNPNEMNITLVFTEDENEKIILSDIAVIEAEGVRKIGTIANNTAEIAIDNEKKPEEVVEEKYALKINKVDEKGNNITQKDVVFKLIDTEGKENLISTNEQGIVTFSGTMPNTPNTYNLKLTEVSAPTGYIKNGNEMTIQVTFDNSTGTMKLTNISVDEAQGITKANEVQNNLAEVNVINKEQKPTAEFTINIHKQDKDTQNNINEEKVGFLVKKAGETNSTYVETNSLGVATFTSIVPEAEESIVYTIKEQKAPTGYIKNENEMIVTLFFDNETGTLSNFEVTGEGIRKISNVNDNTAKVAIDNEKIPEVIPEPRYAIKINKVDENKNNIHQAGVTFRIEGINETYYPETDENGIISFSEIIPETAGTYPIKIQELTSPTGYIKNEKEMTINLTFRETAGEMKLINLSINNDDKEFIEKVSMPQNNQAELKVINKKETGEFSLQIHKQDKDEQTNILQENVVFEVTAPDGTSGFVKTDETGVATYIGKIPSLENSATYTLREISAPTGYIKNLNDMTLTLSFGDVNGEKSLTDVTVVEGEGIRKIADVSENIAQVAVDNEKKTDDTEIEEKYGIRINKVNSDGENILEAGVSFELIDASGNRFNVATNDNGIATFTGVMPTVPGNITYTLNELKAPTGYIKNPNSMTITLTFEDSTGKMALTDIAVGDSQGITKDSGIENNVAQVKVVNEEQKDPEKFTLNIHKQDKDEQTNILQPGVIFEITAPDGTSEFVKTNETGIAVFEGIIPANSENKNYTIKEINAPSGYNKNENEMNITLSFTENSGIVSLNDVIVNNEEGVRKIGTIEDNLAQIAVDNEKIPEVEPEENYALRVNKVDEEGNNINQKDVIFKLVDINGRETILGTNDKGVVTFTGIMPTVAGTHTLKLIEISEPQGYVKNPNEMIIQATFDDSTGKMQLTEISVDEDKGITKVGEVQNNIAEVNVINTVKKPQDKFTIGIEKVDSETLEAIKQEGVLFKVEDSNGNHDFCVTDNKGRAEVEFIMPEAEGTYTYYIKELVQPKGYVINTNKIPLQAKFIEVNGKITLESYIVDDDSTIKVPGAITGNKGFVKVLNEKEDDEVKDTFTLEFNKVDSETLEAIKQEGVLFKVKVQNGKSNYLETLSTGKITLTTELPKKEGTIRYEIEEIIAPKGYKLLTQTQYIDVTFSKVENEMVITNAVVTGSKIKCTYGTEKVVISILNDVEEIKVDEEEPTFDLIINKVDEENLENIEQEGVKFKVTNPENAVSNVETTKKGIASIKLNTPKTEGTYKYKLSEIVAPIGYDKNEKDLFVDITFTDTKGDGKLEITKIDVNEDNGIEAISFEKDKAIVQVLNTKTKVKPDDPTTKDPVFDIETDKYISSITMTYDDTNETIKRTVQNKNGVSKLDVKANRLKHLSLKLEYKIVAKNVGDKEGTISSIVDRIPKGLTMDIKENKGWEVLNNIATYQIEDTVLKPGQSKEVTIVLNYSGKTSNTGEIINYATIDAVDEKDSKKPENTNNIDSATLIVSIKTGEERFVYPILTLISLAIMAVGLIGIKKYVL